MKQNLILALAVLISGCGEKSDSSNDKPVAQQEQEKRQDEGKKDSAPQTPVSQLTPEAKAEPAKEATANPRPEANPTPEAKATEAPAPAPTVIPTKDAVVSEGKSALIGTWKHNRVLETGGAPKITLFVKFDVDKMTVTAKCEANGKTLFASTSAAASIDDSSITTLEESEQKVSEGDHNCRTSISKNTIRYAVNKDELILSDDKQKESFARVSSVTE